jgi:predicted RNase H-like HicB family nuclease
VTDLSRYPTRIFWSDEDEGFIAEATDLPGCSALGETQEQALAELEDAKGAWIEAAQAAGNPIPTPSRPAEASGKMLLRMPKSLHARLTHSAAKEQVSINQYVVSVLSWNEGVVEHRHPATFYGGGVTVGTPIAGVNTMPSVLFTGFQVASFEHSPGVYLQTGASFVTGNINRMVGGGTGDLQVSALQVGTGAPVVSGTGSGGRQTNASSGGVKHEWRLRHG